MRMAAPIIEQLHVTWRMCAREMNTYTAGESNKKAGGGDRNSARISTAFVSGELDACSVCVVGDFASSSAAQSQRALIILKLMSAQR